VDVYGACKFFFLACFIHYHVAHVANIFQSGNEPGSTKAKPDGAWSADQVADYMYAKMKDKKFYILCPDFQVTEQTDKKRMMWSVGDIVNERPPLTRWREEYKEEAEKWMAEQKV
jgi:hypothetical protein